MGGFVEVPFADGFFWELAEELVELALPDYLDQLVVGVTVDRRRDRKGLGRIAPGQLRGSGRIGQLRLKVRLTPWFLSRLGGAFST